MIIFLTCPLLMSVPMPKVSMPALLEMMVRSLTPLARRAARRFSALPLSPKPPTMIVAPSLISETASAAEAIVLAMAAV